MRPLASIINPILQRFLPYQQAWIKDISAIAVHRKSPKIGITYADAMKSLIDACAGFNTEYVAGAVEARRYRQMVCRLALDGQIFVEEIEPFGILKFTNGAMISTQNGFPEEIVPHAVVIDHAAHKPNLKELVGFCLDTNVEQIRLISTCNGANSPFERIQEIVASHIRTYPPEVIQQITSQPISTHTTTLDDAIAAGWFEVLCEATGNDGTFFSAEMYRAKMIEFYGANFQEFLFCEPRKGA